MLHAVAAAYGQRPSRLVGMDVDGADSWAAYQFDAAVLAQGLQAQGLQAQEMPAPGTPAQGRLIAQPASDPKLRFGAMPKVRVKPDGTW